MYELQPDPTAGSARRRDAAEPDGRELNHRLLNSLQLAVDFLGFQQQRTSDPLAREALAEAMARLAAVGQLHRYLTLGVTAAPVELAGYLRGLGAVIARSTGLACEVKAEPVRLPAQTAQQVSLLINECAINARKHAYGPEGGTLRVGAALVPGRRLKLVVSDDGPGLGSGVRQGLGMGIISAILRQLGGAMAAETRGGARFTFLIPLEAPAAVDRSFASWSRT